MPTWMKATVAAMAGLAVLLALPLIHRLIVGKSQSAPAPVTTEAAAIATPTFIPERHSPAAWPSNPALGASAFVPSETLSKEFNANEIQADNDWKGRRLIVEGRVMEISKNGFGEAFLKLDGESHFHDVRVYLVAPAVSQAASVRKGQRVDLVGLCKGMTMNDVILHEGVFVTESQVFEKYPQLAPKPKHRR